MVLVGMKAKEKGKKFVKIQTNSTALRFKFGVNTSLIGM